MSRFFRRPADSDSDSSSSEEEELLSDDESGEEKPKASTSTAKPMSRFLKGAGSDSSSSSDDSDEDGTEDDDEEGGGASAPKRPSRFLKGGSDSDSESDESADVKVVVKSARDKRFEELESYGKAIDNAVRIGDWVVINNEFDKLFRAVQKQSNTSEPVPSVFIRILSTLDGSVTAALAKEKEASKKMEANKARALNGVKQKVRKTAREYDTQVKAYEADPEAYEAQYQAAITVEAPRPPPPPGPTEDGAPAAAGQAGADDFTTVGKGGKQYEFTKDTIYKTLKAVQEARGKKNTDRTEQMKILEKLLEVATTPYSRIRVLLALISARFDYNPSIATHMPIELWSSAQREVDQLVTTLHSNRDYTVIETVALEYDEEIERTPQTEDTPVVLIRGSVISYVERLDEEFTRSLQNIDPHGTEYVDRLKDEKVLYEGICRAQAYFDSKGDLADALARVTMRRIEHIYSKPDAVVQALEIGASAEILKLAKPDFPTLATIGSTATLLRALCVRLYQTENSLLRTRAMLCHVYHHALSNEFHHARDLLLMSHLAETIHNADAQTQILYNRAVVQIGLCAFRSGMIKEAQSTLLEIHTTQRVKELLAQGIHQQRHQQITPEQEKADRQRQLPFHMHINTELLEAAFLVSSMLVEIPLLASIENEELKRKSISKPFRRLLDFADRQVFNGPPETTRDHIMQASKALQEGDWEKCRDLIQSIKIWSLMPEAKEVKKMLEQRIQEEGLRTYLFTFSAYYTTLSLSLLSTTFALPLRTVTSIVSKMIWNEELAASLDHAEGVVVFHRVELTRVQQLTQALADRVAQLVEQNEKALDLKLGGGVTWDNRPENKADRGDQQQERRRGGGRGGSRGGTRGGRGARFSEGLGGRVPAQRQRTAA